MIQIMLILLLYFIIAYYALKAIRNSAGSATDLSATKTENKMRRRFYNTINTVLRTR